MPLNRAVILARFQSRAVVLNARSAPGMEDALRNVSGKPNALRRGYLRVHGYLTNSGEDISRLCRLNTHGQRDLQVQPSTIDVRLDFMTLGPGVSSALWKGRQRLILT